MTIGVNNMYVEELPKNCNDCKFQNNNECLLLDENIQNLKKDCPLKSLKEHDKQLFQQLINMITDRSELISTSVNEWTFMFDMYDLEMCVEEILRRKK